MDMENLNWKDNRKSCKLVEVKFTSYSAANIQSKSKDTFGYAYGFEFESNEQKSQDPSAISATGKPFSQDQDLPTYENLLKIEIEKRKQEEMEMITTKERFTIIDIEDYDEKVKKKKSNCFWSFLAFCC